MMSAESCTHCMSLGSFCKDHDFSKSIMVSEIVREVLLKEHLRPWNDDSIEIIVNFVWKVAKAHSRTESLSEISKLKEELEHYKGIEEGAYIGFMNATMRRMGYDPDEVWMAVHNNKKLRELLERAEFIIKSTTLLSPVERNRDEWLRDYAALTKGEKND